MLNITIFLVLWFRWLPFKPGQFNTFHFWLICFPFRFLELISFTFYIIALQATRSFRITSNFIWVFIYKLVFPGTRPEQPSFLWFLYIVIKFVLCFTINVLIIFFQIHVRNLLNHTVMHVNYLFVANSCNKRLSTLSTLVVCETVITNELTKTIIHNNNILFKRSCPKQIRRHICSEQNNFQLYEKIHIRKKTTKRKNTSMSMVNVDLMLRLSVIVEQGRSFIKKLTIRRNLCRSSKN